MSGARSVESFARKLSDGQTRIAPLYSEAAEGAVAPRWSTSPVRTGVDWASWGSDVAVPRSPAAGLQAGAGESASWIRPEQLATLKADAGDIFLDGPALGVPPGRSIHVLGDPSEPSFQDVWGARGAGQLAVGVRADRLYAEGASTRQVIGAALAGVIVGGDLPHGHDLDGLRKLKPRQLGAVCDAMPGLFDIPKPA